MNSTDKSITNNSVNPDFINISPAKSKPIEVKYSGSKISSDGGLLY